MARKVKANGKTFTFDDNVTDAEIATAVDEYFAGQVKKKVDSQPSVSPSKPKATQPFSPLKSNGNPSFTGGIKEDYDAKVKEQEKLQKEETTKKLGSLNIDFAKTGLDAKAVGNEIKTKLKDASISEIDAFNEVITNNTKNNGSSYIGFKQSSIGKSNELIDNVRNGIELSQEDEEYLKKTSPKAYNELLLDTKYEIPVSVNSIAKEKRKAQQESFALSANQDMVNSANELRQIGLDVNNISANKAVQELAKVESVYNTELEKLNAKYPEKLSSYTGSVYKDNYNPVVKRDDAYNEEKANLDATYGSVKEKIGKLNAYQYAIKNKNSDVEAVGEEVLKVVDPIRYNNFVKAGKKSADVKEDLHKLGYNILQSTNDAELVNKGRSAEQEHENKYPNEVIQETKKRIATEYVKSIGGENYVSNKGSLSIEEADKFIDQLPQKYKKAYLEKIRPYAINQNGITSNITDANNQNYNPGLYTNKELSPKDASIEMPNLGGAVNKFVQGYTQPIEGVFNFALDRLDSDEKVTNRALEKPKTYEQELDGEKEINDIISQLKAKPKLSVQEATELSQKQQELQVQKPFKNVVDGSFSLLGQVIGQAALSEVGTPFVSNALKGVQIGTKSVGFTDKATKIAEYASEVKNIKGASASMVAYVSSYSDAEKEATNLGLDGWKKSLYSNVVAGLNAGTERIFKDEKVLDAFNAEVSPLIGDMVQNLSTRNLTDAVLSRELKTIITKTLPKFAKNMVVENQKEAVEELATQLGTSITKGLLAPDQFNSQEELDAMKQVWYETTIYGGITSFGGAVTETRNSSVSKKAMYELGSNNAEINKFVDVVNTQVSNGKMTQEDANDKIKAVNTMQQIVQKSIPLIDSKRKLTPSEKVKLSNILLAERKLQDEIKNPTYSDVKSLNEKELSKVQDMKNKILNGEVFVDEDLNVYSEDEYNAKRDAELKQQPESNETTTETIPETPIAESATTTGQPIENVGKESATTPTQELPKTEEQIIEPNTKVEDVPSTANVPLDEVQSIQAQIDDLVAKRKTEYDNALAGKEGLSQTVKDNLNKKVSAKYNPQIESLQAKLNEIAKNNVEAKVETNPTEKVGENIQPTAEAKSGLTYEAKTSEVLGTPSIEVKSEEGKKIGQINTYTTESEPNVLISTGIEVNPKFQKQGIAKELYTQLAKQNPGKTIRSSGQITDDSEGVWKSLVRDGIAEKVGDRKYEIKPQQPTTSNQSEIANKTQDEFAQYLQDNHSDKLSQEQIYKLLTVRPELRERMLNESPQEWAKIFEKNTDYRQQANNVDNNKEMRGNANPAWTGISIGETANQESDGRHKGYVTLSVDSAREMGKNLEQTFKDLYKVLKEAGYNGHLKMPGVYSDLLTRFDNIVIHGATKGDISLALPIIEKYFKGKGLTVEGTKTGIDAKDSSGKETSHTNLLAEKVKNKTLEQQPTTQEQGNNAITNKSETDGKSNEAQKTDNGKGQEKNVLNEKAQAEGADVQKASDTPRQMEGEKLDVEYKLRYPKDNVLVFVDPSKVLDRLSKDDPEFDVQNPKNQIGSRVQKAKDYILNYAKDNRWINPKNGSRSDYSKATFEPSIVAINNGKIGFEDGRHRILAAKELGISSIGIEVPKAQAEQFKKEFNTQTKNNKNETGNEIQSPTGSRQINDVLESAGNKAESNNEVELNEAIQEAEQVILETGIKTATIPTKDLIVAPKVFQYKASINESGTNANEQIKDSFDPNDAGTIGVWRDVNNELGNGENKVYVVDGHHRTERARLDNVESMNVFFIDAPTAKDAMIIAARTNIKQGKGTSIDAAKVIRENPNAMKGLVAPNSKVAKEGQALSKLNDKLFEEVSTGNLSMKAAIALSNVSIENQDKVRNTVAKYANNPTATQDRLNRYAILAERQLEKGNANVVSQVNLFGEEFELDTQAMAEVQSEIVSNLKDDARLLNSASRNADVLESANSKIDTETTANEGQKSKLASALFDKQINEKGTREIFDKAVSDYKNAKNKSEKDAIIKRATQKIKDEIVKQEVKLSSKEESKESKEYQSAKRAYDNKRKELYGSAMNDSADLFGNVKSQENSLFGNQTEKADEAKIAKALEPYKVRLDNAKKALDKANKDAQSQGTLFNAKKGNNTSNKSFGNTLKKLISTLQKAIKANVFSDQEILKKKLKEYGLDYTKFMQGVADNVKFMRTPKGVIYGAKFPDGSIYINNEDIDLSSPIHEFSHLFEEMYPELWAEGLRLFRDSSGFKKALKEVQDNPAYSNLTEQQQASEALNNLIGNKGVGYFAKGVLLSKFQNWINKLFKTIGNRIGKQFGIKSLQLTPDDTLDFFVNDVLGKLLGGKELQGETDTSSSNKNDIRFQSEKNNGLVVIHNVNPRGILNADNLGGIPMPSIAISNVDNVFDSFGSISLIGNKNLIDPKQDRNSKVFASDVYSARYPNITYVRKGYVDTGLFNDKERESIAANSIYNDIENGGLDRMSSNTYMKQMYLISKGMAVPLVFKSKEISDKYISKFKSLGLDKLQHWQLKESREFNDLALEYFKENNSQETIDAGRFIEGGQLNKNLVNNYAYTFISDSKELTDEYETSKKVDDLIEEDINGYNEFAKEQYQKAKVEEKIFKGFTNSGNRRYVPHTLANVIKEMKADGIRNGEKFGYGAGSVRATITKQFKSVKDIINSKDKLVDEKEFESVKEEINNELIDLLEEIKPFYKYSGGFGYYDDAGMQLSDLSNRGYSEAFNKIPIELQNKVSEFLNKLQNAPTQYFEAKLTRPVNISEFDTAIVPKGTAQNVLDVLINSGINIVEYDGQEDRQQKIKNVSQSRGIQFQVRQNESQATKSEIENAISSLDVAVSEYDKDDSIDNYLSLNDAFETLAYTSIGDAQSMAKDLSAKYPELKDDFDSLLNEASKPKVESKKVTNESDSIRNLISEEVDGRLYPTIVDSLGKFSKQDTAETTSNVQEREVSGEYVRLTLQNMKDIATQKALQLQDVLGEDWVKKSIEFFEREPFSGNPAIIIGLSNIISTDLDAQIKATTDIKELDTLVALQNRMDRVVNRNGRVASLALNYRRIFTSFAQGDSVTDAMAGNNLTEESKKQIEVVKKALSEQPTDEQLNSVGNVTTPTATPTKTSKSSRKTQTDSSLKSQIKNNAINSLTQVDANGKKVTKTWQDAVREANEEIKKHKC